MSTTEWKCEHCGYTWTGETPPNYCPNCGHQEFKKQDDK